ncbi:uncharacterized protein LAJ45_00469 [Morchella importuna]|uniref:DUF1761-domain-containing protein n=1 Tax=Morchella conica CCBAS932 TaxID=1392247 RepID=A0A3N4KJ15_9PEZI|nr:uncharacterized protein H6S33_009124 [Morchella sextelata]XP_045976763.1 uncharacterized protein LAJ45_00469 [Morchella importuna]KAH0612744.1 hypothetical protein H6S33_009124 [Morchella sextelata]KAH8155459.1 hypothetical protein LAJ45_00469 [Morchella importuna]RPB10510.1 DUF1761-domain-containing protein [Morchella conica CCBAS932]
MASLHYLPPVKPSAVALGTLFTHTTNLAVMAPLFGESYQKAMNADSKQEWIKSKEAAKTATLWGSNVIGSGAQTYAIAALLTQTGVLTYKGAAYVGALIFAATSVPTVVSQLFQERRPAEYIAIRATAGLIETVGLSVFLTWWGIRPAHDLLR